MNSSDVPPISQSHLARYVGQPADRPTPPSGATRGSDRVELSPRGAELSHLLHLVHQLPEVRLDKIEQARTHIEQGTYDQADVLDTVIGNMFAEGDLDE